MNSLVKHGNLYVLTYKRPTKSNRDSAVDSDKKPIYYREIGIDKIDGPYCYPDSNKYRIDATYYDYNDIYSVFLEDILKTGDSSLFEVHDYISYHQKIFGAKFEKYWQSMCTLLSLKVPLDAIIFVDKKYLLISWVPAIAYRYAFPGNEKEKQVAICGGKQIDLKAKYEKFTSFRYIKMVNNNMWYVAYGEQFELVSISTSNFSRISAIKCHHQRYRSHKLLDIGLNTIPNKFKLTNYGEPFNFKHKFIDFVWYDVLQERLKQYKINVVSSGNKKKWHVTPADAHLIFEWPWQKQKYFERQFENGETMFVSDIEMSFSLQSYYLHINGIQLKKDSEGYIFGLESLKDDQYGLYSILLYLESEILNHILDYVSIDDLISMRYVCKEFKEACSNKVESLCSILLKVPPEIQFYLVDYVCINDLQRIPAVCPELRLLCSSKLQSSRFSKFQHKLLIQFE